MRKYIRYIPILLFVILLNGSVHSKRKKDTYSLQNNVLQKPEVTLKFPVYTLKVPSIPTTRMWVKDKVIPYPDSCSKVDKSLKNLRKKIGCVPRDVVVEVAVPDGSNVNPNKVVVKRCGGMCSKTNQMCLSKKQISVDFSVRTTDQKSCMVFGNRISVPEDTECKCGCPDKECSTNQKFDPASCLCLCTNIKEEEACMRKWGEDESFVWNANTCSCGCREEKMCTTGTIWSHDKCRCVMEKNA